ncbi:signal peptidase II [Eubacterium pyruvativorans]|uniref:Lipoprotein signal peptidase n=1 Tax=Eubacterium pyruvativorans TaxID=155865 RepID=A0A1I7G0F0_9FIRM|nr:signal peptidase II [Eubacterium pyruvativorans]SFO00024.1 signal peptidase II [Eubacterium pyruvativorans]SFU41932.1 signal peptidase II [Eubacterium pyruvativorans]
MVYLIVAILVVVADQAVKILVRSTMVQGDSVSVIGDFFRITYINNRGAALGMFASNNKMLLAVPVVIIISIMLFVFLHRYTHPMVKYALTLVAAGGFGNLIDRTLFGQVTDMFSFRIFPPIFNVADIAVTVGCILILIYALFGERMDHRAAGAGKGRPKHGR